MKKITSTLLSTSVALALLSSLSMAKGSDAHWGYTGHDNPANWGELSPKYKMCSMGKNQSPINVTTSLDADLEVLRPKYGSNSKEILNNGHTIQVNVEAGSTLKVDGITFELKQFHFHTPSENHIDGKSFPLEAHFVHLDKEGNIAVLAVMFEEGEENKALSYVWEKMPKGVDTKSALKLSGISEALLPKNKDYYRFNGSLTTPPCSEGVRWLVLKTPVSISKAQVEAFLHIVRHPNNRPIQATNARVIVK